MPLLVYIFIAIELFFVAYLDFKYKKIANLWSVVNIAFFIVCVFAFPEYYQISFKLFFFPVVFVAVGFMLFILNIMGGGDSKYLASLYLLIPLAIQENAFIYLTYTTVLVGGSLFIFNVVKNIEKIIFHFKIGNIKGVKELFGKKFSFAPVILISWMWFGWQTLKLLK